MMDVSDGPARADLDSFAYRTSKGGKVFITWKSKTVTILKGVDAQRFLARIAGLNEHETQLVLAKLTGNFKRGNERQAKHATKQHE
jgi:hypothetical protein